MRFVPISVVIPTKDRPATLTRALESLLASTLVPAEFVIVDASEMKGQQAQIGKLFERAAGGSAVIVQPAKQAGAAVQRNQGVALAQNDYILFCDDDIVCEPDCVERLWNVMRTDAKIGGASAAIVNQSFSRPGVLTRTVLAALGAAEGGGYAGRIVGPAIGFLPDLPANRAGQPDAVPIQWLNTTCTLYRRNYIPDPPFDLFFTGYSLGEDMALSLRVAKQARLINVPAARIFHDSQPGAHKADATALSRMELVNRHYVVTAVMQKRACRDMLRLAVWEICQLAISALQQRGGVLFWKQLWGKLLGMAEIMRDSAARGAR